MPEKSNYTISDIYQGGYSSLSPSHGDIFAGYHVAAGELGAPTGIQTANVLKEINMRLNEGIKPIELQPLQEGVFDQIPKQHFKEVKQLGKLTGSKFSVHAPMIEPSGIGEQGWSESNRELAENQLKSVVERSIEMDDKGGMPIVIHAAGIPGREYKITPEGKKVEKLVVVDQESGKPVQALEEEKLFYPAMEELKPGQEENYKKAIQKVQKGEISEQEFTQNRDAYFRKIPISQGKTITPESRLNTLNHTQWDNQINQHIFNKERADEILQNNQVQIQHLIEDINNKNISPQGLTPSQKQAYDHLTNAQTYLEDTRQHVEGLFHKAYKYGSEGDKNILEQLSKQFQEQLSQSQDATNQSTALQELLLGLKNVNPKLFVPVEDFAIDKSATTFANVAFNSFDKNKDKAPKICIENMFPGMAFSGGKEMDELITKTKEKFVEKATEKGYSQDIAEKQADKLIGMTLDVGHLNIARKKGFTDEDLRKEVEAMAKHVKHVHLTDNFGFSDSHLPPGMGNVPFKEIFEELEKAGTLKDSRKIVEAGGFVQHFGTSPHPSVLQAMGSPVYSTGTGPYWNQAVGFQQGYLGGLGEILPQGHFETFGAGFSQLPSELGGQRGGGGSRVTGRPME
ncbi:sugar phosphate isomerase/epimerase family protein [Nanoarchaeota archaeon]